MEITASTVMQATRAAMFYSTNNITGSHAIAISISDKWNNNPDKGAHLLYKLQEAGSGFAFVILLAEISKWLYSKTIKYLSHSLNGYSPQLVRISTFNQAAPVGAGVKVWRQVNTGIEKLQVLVL